MAVTLFGLASATAGNRAPVSGMLVFPGPKEQVTYREGVAFTATLENTGSSKFTHVDFHNPSPSTTAGYAKLLYASCGSGASLSLGGTFECEMNDISSGGIARVTLVWEMPASGTSVDNPDTTVDEDCDATKTVGGTPDPTPGPCLTNWGFWTMKEGTGNPGSEGPDTFASNVTGVSLLLVPDPAKARGYALTAVGASACTGNPSLETVDVGSGNKLSTEVCASRVPGSSNFPLNPGLVIEIDEGGTGTPPGLSKRVTETSFICIPFPDANPNDAIGSCPATPGYGASLYTPWSFDLPGTTTIVERATFRFTIDNATLPKGEKIDIVVHNGGSPLPPCSTSPNASACVVSIIVDNKLKVTLVTVESTEQGGWDFG